MSDHTWLIVLSIVTGLGMIGLTILGLALLGGLIDHSNRFVDLERRANLDFIAAIRGSGEETVGQWIEKANGHAGHYPVLDPADILHEYRSSHANGTAADVPDQGAPDA